MDTYVPQAAWSAAYPLAQADPLRQALLARFATHGASSRTGLTAPASAGSLARTFWATHRYLFDEAKGKIDAAFVEYWGSIAGTVGGLIGGWGAILAPFAGATWLAMHDDWEREMQQAIVTMDATAESMEGARC